MFFFYIVQNHAQSENQDLTVFTSYLHYRLTNIFYDVFEVHFRAINVVFHEILDNIYVCFDSCLIKQKKTFFFNLYPNPVP